MNTEKEIYEFITSPENAVLSALFEQGIISVDDVAKAMNKKKEEFITAKHKFDIYLDSQGRWRTYYKDPDDPSCKRKLIVKRNKEDVYSVLYDLYTHREERIRKGLITIEELKDEWLEHKKRHGISNATIIKYESDWRCHLEGTPIVRTPIRKLTKLDLDEWAHKLISDNSMTKTDYINVSTLVRQPLDYAVELEIIEYNPMRRVRIEPRMFKPVRKKSSETQVFTKAEVLKLKQVAWEDLDNNKLVHKLSPLAFLFMFQTGLRVGEVCAVRYEDIEGDELHLQRSVERDTNEIKDGLKGDSKERWVILTNEARHIIDEARKRQTAAGVSSSGYVFSMDENFLSYRAASDTFRKYCKKADIDYRSSHKARKTFISTAIDGGVNINTIREFVGHADERTTWNSYCYDRHTKEERKEIFEKALED